MRSFCLLSLAIFLALPLVANAYVRTLSLSGAKLRWPANSVSFSANPTNSSGLSSAQISSVFQDSLGRWNSFGSALSISYSQSTSSPLVSSNDGVNSIFFASAANRGLGFNVIAVTEVTYFVASAEIVGADIIFNDNDFLFTNQEGDTGQLDLSTGRLKVFLGDVATHEFGHAWGLDHSSVHRSSLVYTAFTGQFTPGQDDRSGILSAYPTGASLSASSSITGRVEGTNGGIFAAHVQAINLLSGKVEAGALTNPDGSFRIGDIPAGVYSVMVEAFLPSPGTISIYYNNVDHRFCGGAKFKRAFYASCGANGQAGVVVTNSGAASDIGTVSPSCSTMANAGSQPSSLANAKLLSSGGGSVFGSMGVNGVHYWKLPLGANATVSARAMAYSLYSPLNISVRLLSSNGSPVSATTQEDDVETPMPGGINNYDSRVELVSAAPGDYYLEVRAAANFLTSNLYPAGSQMLDASGFYLLAVAVNGSIPASTGIDMKACASVQNTPQGSLTFASNERSRGPATEGGGCGTVDDETPSDRNLPPGANNLILVIGVALLAQLISRRLATGASYR
jgi:hypothetical protein